MGLRIKKGLIECKKEATAYTAETLTGTNSYPAFDINFEPQGETFERTETSAHFGKQPSLPGMAYATLTYKMLAVGGASGVAPYYAEHLLAAGFRESLATTGTKNCIYTPWSTFGAANSGSDPILRFPGVSYTFAFWEDGVKYGLKGAVSNVKLMGKAGEPLIWEFTVQGAYVAVVDQAVPAGTISALVPPRFLSAGLDVGGTAIVCESFTFDLGNQIQNSVDANDAAGIRGSYIVDRKPTLTLDPEMELVATHNFFANWRAGTAAAFNIGTLGTVAGNKITIDITNIQYGPPKMADRGGVRTLSLECPVVTTSTEGSEAAITFLGT